MILSLIGLWFTNPLLSIAQKTDSLSAKRKIIWLSGYGLGYTAGMTALYRSWYSHYPHSSFHWFDDSNEWEQMDKAGHAFSTFQIAHAYSSTLKWAYYEPKKAVLYGSLASFITVSSIEVFDGFSSKWGASYSDLIANAGGILLYFSQAYFTDKTPVRMKLSFHYTNYADMRPDALGENKFEQIVKDYNGQTYWLSLNFHDCGIKKFPSWLNIAWGYSAEKLISGTCNDAYRQYFLSLDFNSKSIKTKNKLLKAHLLWCFESNKMRFYPEPVYIFSD